nr:PREDICTED: uncharacterized protein LOC106707162 [Latimeria chalumnae]|eukprot:XP_014354550.1 PREDICTED: uncharacterized protein LOC106707162 [Latimeria chalumnae]
MASLRVVFALLLCFVLVCVADGVKPKRSHIDKRQKRHFFGPRQFHNHGKPMKKMGKSILFVNATTSRNLTESEKAILRGFIITSTTLYCLVGIYGLLHLEFVWTLFRKMKKTETVREVIPEALPSSDINSTLMDRPKKRYKVVALISSLIQQCNTYL